MKALSRMTPAIAPSISPLMVWYCNCRSANGTGIGCPLLARQQPARRIAGIGAGHRNILGHHRSCTDDDVVGDSDRHDRRIGADRNPVADHGLAPQISASTRRASGGERVVDEHHAVPDEAVLADGDQLANEGMRLHAGARPDDDALLDLGERADEAVVTELASIKIARLDDLDACAERDVADACLMHLRPGHDTTPSRPSRGMKRSATSAPVSIDS